MKKNPLIGPPKPISSRITGLPILVVGLAAFMLAAAFALALTDEEADQKLRNMGLHVDDPSFPPQLLVAFREMARTMAAHDELFVVSSGESYTYSPEGGIVTMQQLTPPSADSLNHGAQISYDDILELFTFSWWGRPEHDTLWNSPKTW